MAIYAAMIEIMDRNIGRVIEDLRSNRQLDNTLVMFLSDNGACAEWDPWGFDESSGPDNILHKDADLEKMGQPGTYHGYGSGRGECLQHTVVPLLALRSRRRHQHAFYRALARGNYA